MQRRKKAFLLAMMLMIIPIALIMMITLSGQLMQESGQTVMSQRKAKSFYLTHAGLTAAYSLFSINNFQGHTHETDGVTVTPSSSPQFLSTSSLFPDLSVVSGGAYDGYYQWQYTPGTDPVTKSFTRCGDPEVYRFKIYFPTPTTWKIHCEGNAGSQLAIQEMSGNIDDPYGYTIFDNGDCNDLTKAEDESISGKIYSRGDLFVRPWKTEGLVVPIVGIQIVKPTNGILNLDVSSLTSAGRIVRYQDALGEPDPGGTVTISSSTNGLAPTVMNGTTQGRTGQGQAYDSYNGQWRPAPSNTNDVVTRFQGNVLDSEVGVTKRELPSGQILQPGGYYDTRASAHIDSSTTSTTYPWISDKSFYNQAEDRTVHVKEIDVSVMIQSGNFPANGVIYSQVPVRLVNAAKLNQDLTVASSATIYTKGDFNKDNPDGSGPNQSHAAALMTSDRVYNLTDDFSDSGSATYYDPSAPANVLAPHFATDAPHYPGDPANTLEINAAIADGRPTRDSRAWVDAGTEPNFPTTPNPFKVSGYYMNPFDGSSTGTKRIADPTALKIAYPNSDDFLENLQHINVHYGGPRIHMRSANMAKNWDNSDALSDPKITPWIVKSAYVPANSRTYGTSGNAAHPRLVPPLPIYHARILLWKSIQ